MQLTPNPPLVPLPISRFDRWTGHAEAGRGRIQADGRWKDRSASGASNARATYNGVAGVFTDTGKTLDQVIEALHEDSRYRDVADITALLEAKEQLQAA